MRLPGDVAFHRSQAAHYRAVLDGTEQDSYDSPETLYYFHLEQAGDWDPLKREIMAALERIRSRMPEDEFRANAEAFGLVVRLVRCCEARRDYDAAKRWFAELARFDRFLKVDRSIFPWDFSATLPRDAEYEEKIRTMDRELQARGEIPLERRQSFAERMMDLGGLAMTFAGRGEAETIFDQTARLFEPYAFNVKHAQTYLLHDLYVLLRRGGHVKHFLMWRFLQDESFLPDGRAFVLGRLGLVEGLSGRPQRARRYFLEAASLVETSAREERSGPRGLRFARATLLYSRAGERSAVDRSAGQAIHDLRMWYPDAPLGNWGSYGEPLRRVLVARGDFDAARQLAGEMVERYKAEVPTYFEAIHKAGVAASVLPNPYFGLYFCRAFLSDERGARDALEKAEETYRKLVTCAEAPWDYGYREWRHGAAICRHLRAMGVLSAGGASRGDTEAAMDAFRSLLQVTTLGQNGVVLEEELYDFQQMLSRHKLDPLPMSGPTPYVEFDETSFLANLKQARIQRSRPKNMDKELQRFRRRWRHEGWSNEVLDELVTVYQRTGFDVTVWPRDALVGFKMLVERRRSLDIVYSRGFKENAIVAVLVGTARGVIDT